VWIDSETYRLLSGYVKVEELESQSFKGEAEPVVVYRVVGLR